MLNLIFVFIIFVFVIFIGCFIGYNMLFSVIAIIYMKKLHCGFKAAFKYCIDHDIFQMLML